MFLLPATKAPWLQWPKNPLRQTSVPAGAQRPYGSAGKGHRGWNHTGVPWLRNFPGVPVPGLPKDPADDSGEDSAAGCAGRQTARSGWPHRTGTSLWPGHPRRPSSPWPGISGPRIWPASAGAATHCAAVLLPSSAAFLPAFCPRNRSSSHAVPASRSSV